MNQLLPKSQLLSLPLHHSPGSCPLWGVQGSSADRQGAWQARQKSGLGKEVFERLWKLIPQCSSAPAQLQNLGRRMGRQGTTLPVTHRWVCRLEELGKMCTIPMEPQIPLAPTQLFSQELIPQNVLSACSMLNNPVNIHILGIPQWSRQT